MKRFALIALLACTSPLVAADPSLYDQARELYKQGPSQAPEIVRLLREHLRSHPKDLDATSLLGITLFGTSRNDEALPVLDRAIDLAGEKKEIRPAIVMLKARTLYALHRYGECRHILEAYCAFWQDNPDLMRAYEWYYPRVKDAKKPTPEGKPSKRHRRLLAPRMNPIEVGVTSL